MRAGRSATSCASFITDVEMYRANEKGATLKQPASGLLTRAHSAAAPYDLSLARGLEAGESQVVYHGTFNHGDRNKRALRDTW